MRDLPRHADLVVETGEELGIPLQRLGEELERNGLVELQVVGAVHLAHAAAAE
jgi:hypothetical protein